MRQVNFTAIPLQPATTVTSAAIPAVNLFYCSAQASVVGAGSGTLKLQASNDDTNGESNTVPTNWSDIPLATVSVTGAGAFLIPKIDLCYQYVRLVYTNTGAGTINVVFKALGA